MVSITIDNKKIEVPEGTTVLRAAEMAGIHIPTLCDHPHLTPYGGCRLCLVEVEGARTLQPSCTLPVSNNMVVKTDTPKTKDARKFVLTMIFSERNHFCPYCQVSGGDCELQNAAYAEGMTHWPIQPNYVPFEVDASHPYFILENNRCILCRRCVRACGELIGNFTLGIEERGAKSYLIADLGTPLGESTCVSCGSCLQVCPTGALIDRWSAYQGKEKEVEHHKTICVGCSIGCGIDVLTRDNRLVRIEGDWDSPVNEGVICKVGRFLPMTEERMRVLTPMVRKNGALKAATWEEAMAVVEQKVKEASQQKNLAAVISTRLPVEAISLFKQIFADNLQAAPVTTFEQGETTAASLKLAGQLGTSYEGKLNAIHQADCIISFGADMLSNHQVAGFFVKRLLPKKVNLITINKSDDPFADFANCSLKPLKGSYLDVINGITAALLKLGYIIDPAKATKSSEELQKASLNTSIPTEQFLKTAHLIASSENPFVILGDSLNTNGNPDLLSALYHFCHSINAVTDSKKNLIGLKGSANNLTASLLGLDQKLTLQQNTVTYLAIGDEEVSEQRIKTLEKSSFMIVQASYHSKLTANADVVLPTENWLECKGTYINLDGTIQTAQASLVPPDEVKSNQAILEMIASALNIPINSEWKSVIIERPSPVLLNSD